MADRFWRGGTATWDATAGSKWAATAGGATGASVPTAADDVYFDASSTGTCTLSATSVCRSFQQLAGYTGAISQPAATTLNVGDGTAGAGNVAFALQGASTWTVSNVSTSVVALVSTSATQQTINMGGKTIGSLTINGSGSSSYVLAAAASGGGSLTFSNGTFATANHAMSWGSFRWDGAAGSAARTVNLGSSYCTCTGSGGWSALAANLTIGANTATIELSASSATSSVFVALGLNWNGLSVIFGPGGGSFGGSAVGTVANVTLNGGATKDVALTVRTGITVTGTLTVNGNSATNRVLVTTSTTTTTTLTAGVVSFSNVDFVDVVAAGTANWNLSAITGGSGNGGNNTGITFTASAPQSATGTTSFSWSDAARWTSRVPLPQDDVTITQAMNAGATITLDMPRLGRNITIAPTSAGAVTLSLSAFTGTTPVAGVRCYGNYSTTAPSSASNRTLTLAGRGSHTLTTNGSLMSGINIDANTGTYTCMDDVNPVASTTSYNVFSGTFNSRNITGTTFSQSAGTWNPGAFTLTAVTSTSTSPWTVTGGTFNGSASTIVIATRTTNFTFAGGGQTYGTLSYAAGTATMTVSGANAFGTFTAPGRTIILPQSQITAADAWNVDGATISSSHATNVAYISRRYGGRIELTSVALTRIACAQPYGLYATSSTDVAGNLNCIFSAAPPGPYRLQSAVGTGSPTTTATLPRPATAGNLLVAIFTANTGGTATGPAGWTAGPTSFIGASTYVRSYVKVADGTEQVVSATNSLANSVNLLVYEMAGFVGTPTLDVSDGNTSASATSLSTAGTNPSNTGTPAYAIAAVGLNANPTIGAVSNGFQYDYTAFASAVFYVTGKPLSTAAPVSTTFSWSTARQAVTLLLVVKDVATASSGFLLFM